MFLRGSCAARSFVLYCCGRLRCIVIEYSVDAGYFGGDSLYQMVDQLCGQVLYGNLYNVGGVDGADDARPVKCALAVFDAGGFEVGHNSEVLPYFAFQAVLCELFAKDGIGLTNCFETVAGDCAGAAYAKAGAGERLTVYHAVRQAELFADYSDFIFIQKLDGLYQFEIQLFGKSADIVMSLDACFALKDIGINGSLAEELDAFELCSFLCEYLDEFLTDDVALLLGIGNACKQIKESVYCVNIDEVGVHFTAEYADNLLGLSLSEKAVINMYTYQLFTYCLYQHGSDYRGIHASGKCQ